MGNPCPNVGVILGLLSAVGILYTLASKNWKQNSQTSSQNVNRGIQSYEGLWYRCTVPLTGQIQCDEYDESYLGLERYLHGMRAMMCLAVISVVLGATSAALSLPCIRVGSQKQKVMIARVGGAMVFVAASLQAQRAMMVIAGIFAVFGLIAGSLGLRCIGIMTDNAKVKSYTGRSGGILILVAGALTLASVSWYAAEIVQNFYIQVVTEQPFAYEFGAAIYIGWVSSGVALVAGILLVCCNSVDTEDDADVYRYDYRPPQASKPKGSAEYV